MQDQEWGIYVKYDLILYLCLPCLMYFSTEGCVRQETEMKWNESGFRPPLCAYRLNWARRTSWGWWDDWDDTVLQTQDSKFEPWRSEAEHATSRSRRLPTILAFPRGWGRSIFLFLSNRRNREPNPELWRERQRCQETEDTSHWLNHDLMLAHHLRRWANTSLIFGQLSCTYWLYHLSFC